MIRYEYNELIKNMPFPVTIFKEYEDDAFINFFADVNNKHQAMLVEERDDMLIIWYNGFDIVSYGYLYSILIKTIPVSILFPYIDSKEEFDAVISLGAVKVNFNEDEENYKNNKYGSFIIEKKMRK